MGRVIRPAHLDAASWALVATFCVFTVMLAAAIVTSWVEQRRPRRSVGVFEAVFALRRRGLLDASEAEALLGRYDDAQSLAAEVDGL